jgi:hypothetical protein
MKRRSSQYNLPLRVTGWILKAVYFVTLVMIPLHLVLLSFQVTLPLGWLFPLLGRSLLVALASFIVGGFWVAVSSR